MRVWGLMPGDYYVNAVMRGNFGGGFAGGFGGGGFAGPFVPGGRGGGRGGPAPGSTEQEQINYAPTYYPGVPSVNEAKAVSVGLSQEVLDINFGMLLVRIARITGRVLNPDGSPVTSGNVNLTPDTGGGRSNQIATNFGGRIEWDGAFTITNVPPGRYMLRARADDSETPQFGSQPISVDGEDIADVSMMLSSGATIAGIAHLPAGAVQPRPTRRSSGLRRRPPISPTSAGSPTDASRRMGGSR